MFHNIKKGCQTVAVVGIVFCLTEIASHKAHAQLAVPNLQASTVETNKQHSDTVFYVNPETGTDSPSAGKTEAAPGRTITHALTQVQAGAVIQLAPGNYNSDSGEVFPLVIPEGVKLQGNVSNQGQGIEIVGGGRHLSPTFARQNITVRTEKDSAIIGVTITNPNTRGTAVWIESANPTIKNNTFANSHREGIFVAGHATPSIEANVFTQNGGNGISVAGSARGEIRNNLFQDTGFGLAIGGTASPLVAENQIIQNSDGVVVSEQARPVLRHNLIANNKRDGVVVAGCSQAQPDLRTNVSSHTNIFSNNGRFDLNNGKTERQQCL